MAGRTNHRSEEASAVMRVHLTAAMVRRLDTVAASQGIGREEAARRYIEGGVLADEVIYDLNGDLAARLEEASAGLDALLDGVDFDLDLDDVDLDLDEGALEWVR